MPRQARRALVAIAVVVHATHLHFPLIIMLTPSLLLPLVLLMLLLLGRAGGVDCFTGRHAVRMSPISGERDEAQAGEPQGRGAFQRVRRVFTTPTILRAPVSCHFQYFVSPRGNFEILVVVTWWCRERPEAWVVCRVRWQRRPARVLKRRTARKPAVHTDVFCPAAFLRAARLTNMHRSPCQRFGSLCCSPQDRFA